MDEDEEDDEDENGQETYLLALRQVKHIES